MTTMYDIYNAAVEIVDTMPPRDLDRDWALRNKRFISEESEAREYSSSDLYKFINFFHEHNMSFGLLLLARFCKNVPPHIAIEAVEKFRITEGHVSWSHTYMAEYFLRNGHNYDADTVEFLIADDWNPYFQHIAIRNNHTIPLSIIIGDLLDMLAEASDDTYAFVEKQRGLREYFAQHELDVAGLVAADPEHEDLILNGLAYVIPLGELKQKWPQYFKSYKFTAAYKHCKSVGDITEFFKGAQ